MSSSRSFVSRVGLLVCLALSGLATGAAASEETLRWKFKVGEILRYEFRQTCGIKVKGAEGPASDDTSELTIDLTWKVKAITPDGSAEIALSVDRVRSESRTGTQKVHYDSKNEEKPDPAAEALKLVYRKAVGEGYALKVTDRGQVIEASVPPGVTEALRGSPFLSTADGGSVLSAQGLKNLFAQLIPVLPEASIDKSAAWSTSVDLPAPPLRMVLTYRDVLSALDENSARVDATIETAIRPDREAPIKVDIKTQSGNRVVTLDLTRGRVTESTVKQAVELTLGLRKREVDQVITLDERLILVP